jgi:hypothetical protein
MPVPFSPVPFRPLIERGRGTGLRPFDKVTSMERALERDYLIGFVIVSCLSKMAWNGLGTGFGTGIVKKGLERALERAFMLKL